MTMKLHVLIGLAILAGCGKAPNSTLPADASSNPSTFTGTYVGQVQGTQNGASFDTQVTLVLTQQSDVISGSFSDPNGDTGTIQGTAASDDASLSVTLSGTGCLDTMAVTVYPTATGLAGAIWGTNTPCGTLGSAVQFIKQ